MVRFVEVKNFWSLETINLGAWGSVVVKALRY